MKNRILPVAVALTMLLGACSKTIDSVKDRFGANAPADATITHLIARGTHNSQKNGYKPVNTTEMKFRVTFDNSAKYQTAHPDNQGDINKLYGFSDNNQEHHTNSARIGWRWYQNELQLHAYVYNNGVQSDKLITSVPLHQPIDCSIRIAGNEYIITANGSTVHMPRTSATATAVGYQLYPYFGGDEAAPQDITILIKDL